MSIPVLFNRDHLRRQRARAAGDFATYRFLHDWCEREILDRLELVRRTFPTVALLSDRPSENFRKALTDQKGVTDFVTLDDTDHLAVAPSSVDMAVSIFDLHTINDLPGTLVQVRQALKPDGLFIACMPGGETLHELRTVLMETELSLAGGASPHVFPFADKQQMGALLQRAAFALPVVNSDILKVAYRDLFHLMDDLRGMGEGNALAVRRPAILPKAFFPMADTLYKSKFPDHDDKITASFEIISLIGWAPHVSQPQPLKRGSGQVSLKTALS